MTLTNRNVLSIIECIFYTPTTVLSLLLCIRHCCRGQRSQIAWVFLYIYCHIRVAEAALGLATITFPSIALHGTTILFSLIGVPALLLTTFGLLNRVYINLAKNLPTRIKPWYFSLLQIPFEAAIGLCANGASKSTADASDGTIYQPQIWTKVGIMLCVVGFIVMVILTGAMLRRQSHAEISERRLLNSVTLSLPFLFIRMSYTVLVTFVDRGLFGSYEGNVLVVGMMSVLPEMVVVIIYIVEGFILEKLPKDARKEKCRRKKGGWPCQAERLDDFSITRTGSEQGWKDLDDGSSGISRV
ncbi:uncharacterized protein K444DRAFT_609189 [Hyaloscypha bicolor E]|uniref:DUF7702 domain-containing protein n=1 Tax=Hyaloscypha bicolor E TaxID=1095630 RepID=A0A2J6TMH4_9HELO|nr:uncharacterized protein K444DRAFT_609189 [Hyaloscypha bicolor E]PMD64225.1 hypothetical protein K444DRAFT_609189 [Hyaloscypha bicolor E]